MRNAGLLILVLSIGLIDPAQESGVDGAGYPEVQYGAQTYRDAHSGVIFYIESDARHLSAISRTGKLLWTRDPFSDAHLNLYRTKHPQICEIGPGPKSAWGHGNPLGFIYIGYNSSQFGIVRISDGKFFFGGEN